MREKETGFCFEVKVKKTKGRRKSETKLTNKRKKENFVKMNSEKK